MLELPAGRAGAAALLFEDVLELVDPLLGELTEEVLLGREVVEEGLLGDVRVLGDLVDRGVVEAPADEVLHRRGHDALADLALAPLAPAEVVARFAHRQTSQTGRL